MGPVCDNIAAEAEYAAFEKPAFYLFTYDVRLTLAVTGQVYIQDLFIFFLHFSSVSLLSSLPEEKLYPQV